MATLLKQEEKIVSIPQKEAEKQNEAEETPKLEFRDDEKKYLTGIQSRLKRAKEARDTRHDEFDGMNYYTWCEANRKLANTYIAPRKNREDSNYVSGIVRQKLLALLAAINNLDLSADVNAFDKDDISIPAIGQGMEDIIWKTEEVDDDEEKKLMRQYTLLEQGTVFVNEAWVERFEFEKRLTSNFSGKLDSAKWNKRMRRAFQGASRELIKNENVYLGDITQPEIKKQPYLFTVEYMPYETAKAIYGNWERWENVPRHRKSFDTERDESGKLYDRTFTLHPIKDNQVEIIKYQDKPNNEFQIILNSVPMLPIGFPMPWGWGEYSLTQQIYSLVHAKFAYGKSLVSMLRVQSAVYDEMLRLMVLKTQKSFKPPRANLTGKVLSPRVFMPGVVSHGFDPEQLKYVDPESVGGISASEATAIKIIQENIDSLSVNPTFAGQQPAGTPTATQIIEVQRQARMVLGLTVFAASQLEKKLAELRLYNIIKNWFKEEDKAVDKARDILKGTFRQFSRPATIEQEGAGQRITRITEEIPEIPEQIREEENIKRSTGVPTRITYLNPSQIREAKLRWHITVIPKEKKSSPANKLMFREMLADIQLFAPLGTINWQHLAERFAINWEENPEKLFLRSGQQSAATPAAAGIGDNTGRGVGDRMLRPAGGEFGFPAAGANQPGVSSNVPPV